MKRKIRKSAVSAGLCLALMLSLCSCGQKSQSVPTTSEIEENTALKDLAQRKRISAEETEAVEALQEEMSAEAAASSASSNWSAEGSASLTKLLNKIGGPPDTLFGVAYLGYVGGLFDGGFAEEFPQWLRENNPALLAEYPFIAEIDAAHILGGAGHLYCIVPTDPNATISVNRVNWDAGSRSGTVQEMLYREESGEPVLLFANLDGNACHVDSQLFVTANDGTTCEWYPSMDEEGYLVPCINDGVCYFWDFSDYPYSAAGDMTDWLADGWLGPTALGLMGEDPSFGSMWCTQGNAWESDRYAYFNLWFYPGDAESGTMDIDFLYEGQEDYAEQWSGFWTLQTAEDRPSYISISISLVGGTEYDSTDGPRYIAETYPILISQSGIDIVIGKGQNNVCLPFMNQSTLACVLSQASG